MAFYYGWKPYVPVAERRRQAGQKLAKMRKKGLDVQPVEIEGRKIVRTFWGEAWCKHMEALGDFANRLPRGRSYVRNGSVCHLAVEKGKVTAIVSGSELYNVVIKINPLNKGNWSGIKQQCSGHIGSLLELLAGRISDGVMEVVTNRKGGLFPMPNEISFKCDCPDYAYLCKHVAAVMYGVGARLDRNPESLFLLRGVDHSELITASADAAVEQATTRGGGRRRVAAADLSDVFGVELESEPLDKPSAAATTSPKRKRAAKSKADAPPAKATKKTAKTAGGSRAAEKVDSGASARSAKKKSSPRKSAKRSKAQREPASKVAK